MNAYYPFTTPLILTDDIFINYGGGTGTTTTAQRQAVYAIAEEFVVRDINTFLLPYIVTGTYPLTYDLLPIILDYGYVNSIEVVRFIDTEEDIYYTISGTANIKASLRDPARGILDIHWLMGNYAGCGATYRMPYQVQVVYNAGLATGTANSPIFELALTTIADEFLNEIEGYGNEAPGGVGVQRYFNQQYNETRVKLLRTTYGTSAKMNFVHKLLSNWRKPRYIRL